MYLEIFQQLGVALVLSSLVGLERERKYQLYDYKGFGGIRTFALIGVLGALSYILSFSTPLIFPVITAGFLLMVSISYFITAKQYGMTGATSEIAAVLIFLVGVLCARSDYVLAVSISLIVLAALHFKSGLHKWAKQLKSQEMVSTIQFMIIAFVVLPLLPNQGYGPYEFFNPYVIWLMVVFISGISFASYIAIKLFGENRGIFVTGFLAGLISSTALTLSFSAESKKNKKIVTPYAVAVIVASSAMFFRILVEVSVLNQELFSELLLPMGVMGVVGILAFLIFLLKKDPKKSNKSLKRDFSKMKSPFSFVPALKFGAFFAAILFISSFLMDQFGNKGLYLTSFVGGLMDVDAITLDVSNKEGISTTVGVTAITIAAMVNTVVKGGIFMMLGNKKVAVKIALVYALMILVGVICLFAF